MKKNKVIGLVVIAAMVMGASITAFAGFTPKYKPLSESGYNGVPEVKVTLSDSTKEGINKSVEEAVKNLDIKLLKTPNIISSKYIHAGYKDQLFVCWDKVEDATSYEILVKKPDGSTHTYTSNYPLLIVYREDDGFISDCITSGTVKVRAVKDNGALYSLWTKEITISCNNTH